MNNITLNTGDALQWLKKFPDGSVSLAITDPPYASLKKYDAVRKPIRHLRSKAETSRGFSSSKFDVLFSEIYRVLKNNSHFYLFCDKKGMFDLKPLVEEAGFKFWKPLIWDKEKNAVGYHYCDQYDAILFFEKGVRRLNDLKISDIIRQERKVAGYPKQKPVPIIELLIKQSSSPGEIVIDPFMGSGSTALAALKQDRNFLGNDISENAVRYTKNRLNV